VQEAAFQACRGFRTYLPGSNFKAWFFRILTNCFYSKHRKQRREGIPVELDDTRELSCTTKPPRRACIGNPDPPAGCWTGSTARPSARTIASMPEDYRVVATLCFWDCSIRRRGILQIPVGTVSLCTGPAHAAEGFMDDRRRTRLVAGCAQAGGSRRD
jgi:RNA polymerase sigma-70 factor (ECF subfamily)